MLLHLSALGIISKACGSWRNGLRRSMSLLLVWPPLLFWKCNLLWWLAFCGVLHGLGSVSLFIVTMQLSRLSLKNAVHLVLSLLRRLSWQSVIGNCIINVVHVTDYTTKFFFVSVFRNFTRPALQQTKSPSSAQFFLTVGLTSTLKTLTESAKKYMMKGVANSLNSAKS